jgi:hypothetical protein
MKNPGRATEYLVDHAATPLFIDPSPLKKFSRIFNPFAVRGKGQKIPVAVK